MKSPFDLLNEKIISFKYQQEQQLAELKTHFKATTTSLSPLNILKNTGKEIFELVKKEENILETMVTLSINEFTKKAVNVISNNTITKNIKKLFSK